MSHTNNFISNFFPKRNKKKEFKFLFNKLQRGKYYQRSKTWSTTDKLFIPSIFKLNAIKTDHIDKEIPTGGSRVLVLEIIDKIDIIQAH